MRRRLAALADHSLVKGYQQILQEYLAAHAFATANHVANKKSAPHEPRDGKDDKDGKDEGHCGMALASVLCLHVFAVPETRGDVRIGLLRNMRQE